MKKFFSDFILRNKALFSSPEQMWDEDMKSSQNGLLVCVLPLLAMYIIISLVTEFLYTDFVFYQWLLKVILRTFSYVCGYVLAKFLLVGIWDSLCRSFIDDYSVSSRAYSLWISYSFMILIITDMVSAIMCDNDGFFYALYIFVFWVIIMGMKHIGFENQRNKLFLSIPIVAVSFSPWIVQKMLYLMMGI